MPEVGISGPSDTTGDHLGLLCGERCGDALYFSWS